MLIIQGVSPVAQKKHESLVPGSWIAYIFGHIWHTSSAASTGLNYPSVPGWRQCWARGKKASPEGEGDMKRAHHGHQNRTKHNLAMLHTADPNPHPPHPQERRTSETVYTSCYARKQLSLHATVGVLQKQYTYIYIYILSQTRIMFHNTDIH